MNEEEGILGIIKKISKTKLKTQNENNNSDQNINRSNINMLNKEDFLNENQLDKMFEQKKEKKNKFFMDFNLIKDFKFLDRGNCSTINFNLLDYYCLKKMTRKKTEIELFKFGINFYKSQMDIINFFNVLFLTQIMLTQQSEKKQGFLSQKIEFNI